MRIVDFQTVISRKNAIALWNFYCCRANVISWYYYIRALTGFLVVVLSLDGVECGEAADEGSTSSRYNPLLHRSAGRV